MVPRSCNNNIEFTILMIILLPICIVIIEVNDYSSVYSYIGNTRNCYLLPNKCMGSKILKFALLLQDNPVTSVDCVPAFLSSPNKCLAVCVTPSVVFSNNINKNKSSNLEVAMTTSHVSPLYPRKLKPESLYERRQCLNHRFASPRLLHLSPCRINRPSSRNSLSSRLSSSHNSLVTQFQADDSSFITQAISHDTLSAKTSDITDMYNVPFDSDIYAVPIDMVRPSHSNVRGKGKKPQRNNRRREKSSSQSTGVNSVAPDRGYKSKEARHKDTKTKRHSLPSSSCKKNVTDSDTDSLHLTLREMRKYLHTLYSSSSDSECRNTMNKKSNTIITNVGIHMRHGNKDTGTAVFLKESNEISRTVETNNNNKKANKNTLTMNSKSKKHKENIPKDCSMIEENKDKKGSHGSKVKMSPVRMLSMNLKQSFCNLFRWRKSSDSDSVERVGRDPPAAVRRALPPLPQSPHQSNSRRIANEEDTIMDFATSIQRVKDVSNCLLSFT